MAEEQQQHQDITNKLAMNMIGLGIKNELNNTKTVKGQQMY